MVASVSPTRLSPALIVDDAAATRARLHALLLAQGVDSGRIELVADISSARAACARGRFAFALVDIGLPDGSGLELIEWLGQSRPEVVSIVVSSFGTEELVVGALRRGAHGYLLKERDDAELAAALRSVESGGMPIDPLVARHILKLVDAGVLRAVPAQAANEADVDGAEPAGLTPRELEILGWVARGLISREIANRLERSPQTVECHIKNIFRKIGASTRTEAVSKARERGLLR